MYPTLIKENKTYNVYKYNHSGVIEISSIDNNYTQQYIGYSISESVKLFKDELKGLINV